MPDNAMNDLQRSLGRLEGKLDGLTLMIQDHIIKDEAAWGRISRIEKRMWWLNGIIATIIFFMTTGVSSMLTKIGLFK